MKTLIFLGSVRDSHPPRPARLGARVASAMLKHLEHCGLEGEFEVIDPLAYELGGIFKPHFAYAKGKAPEALEGLAGKIHDADAFVMVSPEYNHSISPALSHLLNHFGSSSFGYKPSLIVTYSAGQWGGVRAAVGMRTYLSELGCLPVSAMIHVPHAADVFDESGRYHSSEDAERWKHYLQRGVAQLKWWSDAAASQRESVDPHEQINDFLQDPAQRNAPT